MGAKKNHEDLLAELRKRILKKLDDLKVKIETKQRLLEKEQDHSLLSEIDDSLETSLNNWYY
jgi:hypothetical protein